MKKTFDTFEYVNDLGKDLIRDFEKAGKTTHPHAVGEGREKSAINKLKDILPSGVGIGSGFVIDSFGCVSAQCDIVIYEKDLCLKFNNDDERNCYYNCESVIAVGEVKSVLSHEELCDCIEKIKIIRNLKRVQDNNREFRHYLSKLTAYGSEYEKFDQNNNSYDQIFTFVICGSFVYDYVKIIEEINKIESKYEFPNAIASVDGRYIGYSKMMPDNKKYNFISALDSDSLTYSNNTCSFSMLLDRIFHFIEHGRSVRYNPSLYILKNFTSNVICFPIHDK